MMRKLDIFIIACLLLLTFVIVTVEGEVLRYTLENRKLISANVKLIHNNLKLIRKLIK